MFISLNLVDFLILALVLQGFILAALLYYSSKKLSSNKWMAALIFVISALTLVMEMDYAKIWENYPKLLILAIQPTMLLGPLLYFYVKRIIFGDEKLAFKDYLHFAPLLYDLKFQLVTLFSITGLLTLSFFQNLFFSPFFQQMLFRPGYWDILPAFISMTIYAAIAYQMVLKNQHSHASSAYKQADLRWIKNLLYGFFILIPIWAISIVSNINLAGSQEAWRHFIIYLPAVVLVYWMGMSTYLRQNKMTTDDVETYTGKSTRSFFSEGEAINYQHQLLLLMTSEQLYLNPLLKLENLSARLSIPEKAVSNLLNHYMGKNFNDFVNEYRVEEAMKKLTDPANRNFTISGIALDCGFNSLATFQRVFKQITGITPSRYQKTLKYPINSPQIGI